MLKHGSELRGSDVLRLSSVRLVKIKDSCQPYQHCMDCILVHWMNKS